MNDPMELPLRDIHLPDGVAFWPPAYGWWILLALVVAGILVILFVRWRNRRIRNSAITLAKKDYARIVSAYRADHNPVKLARESSVLLRRLSISLFPRSEVASLTGDEWLEFLDQQVTGSPFSNGDGRLLVEAPYRRDTEKHEMESFIEHCRNWIESVSGRGTRSA